MIYSEAFFRITFTLTSMVLRTFFFFFANDTTPVVYNLFSAVENAENLFSKRLLFNSIAIHSFNFKLPILNYL